MDNWMLFFLQTAVCLPGLLIVASRTLSALESLIKQASSSKKKPTSWATQLELALLQKLALMSAFNAFGTILAPKVGLNVPFFKTLVSNTDAWAALTPQLLPARAFGIVGGIAVRLRLLLAIPSSP